MTRSFAQLNTDLGGAFGQFPQYAENTTPADTTSAVFAEYLSMVTPVLPAGTYRLGWNFNFEASTAATIGEYRIQIDDSAVIPDVDVETLGIASSFERKAFSNRSHEVLLAGSHKIDIDFRRSGGVGTFTIDDAKLEIWRVS